MIKKIMFHVNSLGKGGAERVIVNLAGQFVKKGIDVIIATEWQAEDEYVPVSAVRRIDVGLTDAEEKLGRRKKQTIRKNRLRKLIVNERPDAVLAFCRNANYRAVLAASGTGVPCIVSVRNDPKVYYASVTQKIISKYLYGKAEGIVFQTDEAADFFRGKIQEKSRVILNPISENYLNLPKDAQLAGDKDLNNKDVNIEGVNKRKSIVSVGRITDAKDQITLIKAYEKLIGIDDIYKDYKLEIYGERGEDDTLDLLTKYIDEHKLGEQVVFMGLSSHLEKDIVDDYMFVLPSKYEGMPNALLEAMVLGLPVISTDCPCGGPRMLINDGDNGYLVPVGDVDCICDRMKTLVDDVDKARSMGKKAAEVVDKVLPEVIADEWLGYVKALI